MTNKLGKGDKQNMTSEFSFLLGRMFTAMPWPIEENLAVVVNRMIPAKYREALELLCTSGYPLHQTVSYHASIKFPISTGYLLSATTFPAWNSPIWEQAFWHHPHMQHGMRQVDDKHMRIGLGVEYDKFVNWVEQMAPLVGEVERAWKTVGEILEMASTAGQLKGMVPELVQYLPPARQEFLRGQLKASSLPYEWASYDRPAVRAMLLTMSKCYLLPKTDYTMDSRPPVWVREEA